MKGIMPAGCRILGYALLILSVFAPLGMYMSGQVNDGNLAIVKLGMKLVIWLSLFMIFLAKHKEEDETAASLRTKAMKYALLAWGVYYAGALVKGMAEGDAQGADNSAAIIYMVLTVLCLEFLVQKRKAEKAFKRK
ncbi:MAG: hypothetical protein MR387_06360 [Phocaeicola plebeius]|nr:hypothetical protein [Phocaeicola plebeius]